MENYYTENLADFGSRERLMLESILHAWSTSGLPEDFDGTGVKPAFNKNSGYVFLVNSDFQTAMMNGDKLESFYSTPYNGNEGFWSYLVGDYPDMHPEDQQYMIDIANGRQLPAIVTL